MNATLGVYAGPGGRRGRRVRRRRGRGRGPAVVVGPRGPRRPDVVVVPDRRRRRRRRGGAVIISGKANNDSSSSSSYSEDDDGFAQAGDPYATDSETSSSYAHHSRRKGGSRRGKSRGDSSSESSSSSSSSDSYSYSYSDSSDESSEADNGSSRRPARARSPTRAIPPAVPGTVVLRAEGQNKIEALHDELREHPDIDNKVLFGKKIKCVDCGAEKCDVPALDNHVCKPVVLAAGDSLKANCSSCGGKKKVKKQQVDEEEDDDDVVLFNKKHGHGHHHSHHHAKHACCPKPDPCEPEPVVCCPPPEPVVVCCPPKPCHETEILEDIVEPELECDTCDQRDVLLTENYDCWMEKAEPCEEEEPECVTLSALGANQRFNAKAAAKCIRAGKPFETTFKHSYIADKVSAAKRTKPLSQCMQKIQVRVRGQMNWSKDGKHAFPISASIAPLAKDGKTPSEKAKRATVAEFKMAKGKKLVMFPVDKNVNALKKHIPAQAVAEVLRQIDAINAQF